MTTQTDRTPDKELEAARERDLGAPPKVFTIGYGGRKPEDLAALLCGRQVKTVVDTRLRPDRASMGAYIKAKTADKGIERLLQGAGLSYVSLVELGNVFVDLPDWEPRYRRLLDASGELLVERVLRLPMPICLLCCEKDANRCHRRLIAEFLARRGWVVEHIA